MVISVSLNNARNSVKSSRNWNICANNSNNSVYGDNTAVDIQRFIKRPPVKSGSQIHSCMRALTHAHSEERLWYNSNNID